MTTITVEYNEKDKYAKQVMMGLIGSGIIRRKKEIENPRISLLKAALRETQMMSAHIAQNGTAGCKTLDDLLNEDEA
jgi:hypothetical protein